MRDSLWYKGFPDRRGLFTQAKIKKSESESETETDSACSDQVVKVCIAMMLPLLFLTGTPSNRTSRALRRTGVRVGWAEGGLCGGKCMLNPCSDVP